MTTAEFTTLVWQMRQHQRRYFQHRDQTDLIESKRLERQVDSCLAELRTTPRGNMPLFDAREELAQ